MDLRYILALCFLIHNQSSSAQPAEFEYKPEQYVCFQAIQPIEADGMLEEAEWAQAPWTKPFVDIEGSKRPLPYYETRVKMLWDEQYLYIAAELEEENLWATYDQRDAVIYQENNFEVFIDPDGDTHNYYELEINALATVWDLLLTKPYRDGGLAINGWDISGLKKGIHLSGTLNDPSDTDRGWAVELAIPWKAITRKIPGEGEIWRANFSRVEWKTENESGAYRKSIDPATGKAFPEFNWVWSPQGVVAMHRPETWGFVQFTEAKAEETKVDFLQDPDDEIKWLLRQVYYAERAYKQKQGRYTGELSTLELPPAVSAHQHLKILATEHIFVAWIRMEGSTWYIREDGKVWKEKNL
ncbi:MAG: carbohydrate-binding family 9-like protein [Phaeodactylibacter sp.]|nr:carbohydrate-binding family 9-like protein [Phaeodactylibacter sp.]